MNIRVVLVDDHEMMRDGLRAVLEKDAQVEVVGEAGDGRTALEVIERLQPDIVVMDVGMSGLNGIDTTAQLRTRHPQVKVVALSTHQDRRFVLGMLDAGAAAYVPKASAYGELARAIQAVMRNEHYLSPQITDVVVKSYVGGMLPTARTDGPVLTRREREVLQLVAEGKTSDQIATRLGISSHSVEAHRRNLMRKLDLHSVAELTKYAIREGITSVDD